MLTNLIQIGIGLLISLCSGIAVQKLLDRPGLQMTVPDGVNMEVWNALQPGGVERAGPVLGMLERLVAFAAAWLGQYEILVAWLAFKVASKWEVWSNVVRLPESLEGVSPVEYLKARRIWGSAILMRFLIGTLANVLIGVAAAIAVKYAW